jgi:hypothetical protein
MKLKNFILIVLIVILCDLSLYAAKHNTTNIADVSDAVKKDLQAHSDLIVVDLPQISAEISSPLAISGKARGKWYFEASFPVKLLDGNGKQIAIAPAQAQGEWMTQDFVPFSVTLTFEKPTTATGTLVLQKDNPSDMRELDDSISIPVVFK